MAADVGRTPPHRRTGAGVLGSMRSGALGIDDASAHVASTFLITSAGSDAGDEGSAGVAGAFAKSAASGAKGIDDGSAGASVGSREIWAQPT